LEQAVEEAVKGRLSFANTWSIAINELGQSGFGQGSPAGTGPDHSVPLNHRGGKQIVRLLEEL
jgi:hypothetical protein